MAGRLSFLVGFGAGYVLGARSGRERYEQIASKAQEVWRDPRVQERTGQAQQLVKDKAGAAGSMVSEKVKEKTGSNGSGARSGATAATSGDSGVFSGTGGGAS